MEDCKPGDRRVVLVEHTLAWNQLDSRLDFDWGELWDVHGTIYYVILPCRRPAQDELAVLECIDSTNVPEYAIPTSYWRLVDNDTN